MDQPHQLAQSETSAKRKVALVLQGGGALGAYHIGAYEALHDTDLLDAGGAKLDWVTGISIGAFNSAIIAGNEPERRLEKLEEFWQIISRPNDWAVALHAAAPKLYNQWSYWEAVSLGQPNFFFPRMPGPYFMPPNLLARGAPDATSFYDTAPLLETLRRVTNFDFINKVGGDGARPPRVSLGATDVESGELRFFDNTLGDTIGPEHVAASGSLPPGFPFQPIDERHFWDGACVSNTALEALLQDESAEPILALVIDLWSPVGPLPATMDDVQWRQKQIQYASRTEHAVRAVATRHELRRRVAAERLSLDRALPEDARLAAKELDIVHIVYHPADEQVPGSDAEFSRLSIAERRAAGKADMQQALAEVVGPLREAPQAVRLLAAADVPGTDQAAGGNGTRVHLLTAGQKHTYTATQIASGQAPTVASVLQGAPGTRPAHAA